MDSILVNLQVVALEAIVSKKQSPTLAMIIRISLRMDAYAFPKCE
jgi:hypothetical protein